MEYTALAYYYIGNIQDPHREVALHKEFLKKLDFTSRIYISEEGINGQASASIAATEEYISWMQERQDFPNIVFKMQPAQEHLFPRLTVKYRKELVAIGRPVNFSLRGESLSPQQWREKLEAKEENTLLLDVRNQYEWKVGHFKGATLPPLETFREFPSYAKELKEKFDPQETTVMMYCTGGIRCEFYSALLKEEGFTQVFQLEGGVIGYGEAEGNKHWEGKLFVFDDRLVTDVGKDSASPISVCSLCALPTDLYYNCANPDCNALFLCCKGCIPRYKGACSLECMESAKRLRPFSFDNKPFRRGA